MNRIKRAIGIHGIRLPVVQLLMISVEAYFVFCVFNSSNLCNSKTREEVVEKKTVKS